MTIQRPPLFATSGWLAAAGLSVAAHVGGVAVLSAAGSVDPVVSSRVAPLMQVRVIPADPAVSHNGSATATAARPAPRPSPKSAAIDQSASGHLAVRAPGDPWDSFLPSHALDVSPLPRSSPDLSVLNGASSSGLPLRLRLFVDERGRVVEVHAMQVQLGDEEVIVRLRHMFLETLFLPGKLRGNDVASYMDLELAITDAK